jgi:protein involved in polysaccharide export with SLBB domain
MKAKIIVGSLTLFGFVSALLAADAPSTSARKDAGAPKFVFVGGEVLAPGRFVWTNGLMVTHSIERAGGFSMTADRTKIEIRTSGSVTQVCNYASAVSNPVKDVTLSPGDVVFVPRSKLRDGVTEATARLGIQANLPPPERGERFVVVEGAVHHPGQLGWSNGMRLSIALEAAGGLAASADAGRVQIRHHNGGVDTANYFDATNSPTKDYYLLRGDRITVPQKGADK